MPIDMELEAVLRPMQYPMPAYPSKVITLANGKKMVVRQATREDVPAILITTASHCKAAGKAVLLQSGCQGRQPYPSESYWQVLRS